MLPGQIQSPVNARHAEPSMIFSADDDCSRPNDRLIGAALSAVQAAREVDFSALSKRMKAPPYYPDVWPGEHYKLLAGFMLTLKPEVVIEIGTATGLSALAMKQFLPAASKVVTFDVIPWDRFQDTVLTPEDFSDGRLTQHIADLSKPWNISLFAETISRSTFLFIDAAKDGALETELIIQLRTVPFASPPLVVFDDIRLWNMLKIWREVTAPKLDLTSFGHWSGTGLVDWTPAAD